MLEFITTTKTAEESEEREGIRLFYLIYWNELLKIELYSVERKSK